MIGKVFTGKSAYHCLSYCLEDKWELSEEQKAKLSLEDGLAHKGRAEVLEYNYCFGDKHELSEQFKEVRRLNKNVEKPVFHLSMRLANGDKLTNEQWREVAREAAKEFQFDQNQYVVILHKDTQQPHIHIVANRIGYQGKTANDSNSYLRMAQLCRRMEQKYDLQEVQSPRRFLSPKERQAPRQDQRKERLKEKIVGALNGSKDFPEFEKRITAEGYRVDKGRGIAFEDDKNVRIKGSEVGYSLSTIEKTLAENRRLQFKENLEQQQKFKESIRQGQTKSKIGTGQGKGYGQGQSASPKPGSGSAGGLVKLVNDLLKPEYIGGGGGSDPFEDDEERRRKRKGIRK
ncbi:MAG TPA: relaxase/mobilization nuclease domain-containing protein [Puia sp.]|uniref:relaxase/mobilization nuclease domain-containing protein n=1 Tax=Puia sp. TaxID=2045100 RepID=UPI002D177921|nr:relaxase/mobilization nuclease domain-containing protein [Puia sp.]HVU93719.1 relaxase/mobilization nuclease domain-containing protein [Puia sp.]